MIGDGRLRITMQVDEGSPGVPMPIGNATELRKANAARRRRQRESYAVLTKHIARRHEHLKYIRTNHFQDGQTAFNYGPHQPGCRHLRASRGSYYA